ncbi:MAG: DUF6677 family protein [Thermoanaerobaculia bacterium]|nr:DUF6677 family protein [Thermoanaerobaculia bacterium]
MSEGPEKVERRPALVVLVLASWLVPGAGHFALGHRRRGVAFLAIVAAAIGIGLSLHGNLYGIEPGRPLSLLFTLAAMGMGAPYFVLRFVLGYAGEIAAAGFEYGTAFLLTAGLMNLLLVLDVWDLARGVKE